MNTYEAKKAARIERLRARAEKKRQVAEANGLDLFSEEKSGIPLGQPILVGHHSERRHRRHLERIENRVRKGMEAGRQASELEERAAAAETRTAIDSDNPEASTLIADKIKKLETERDRYKMLNALMRASVDCVDPVFVLTGKIMEKFPDVRDARQMAVNLLTPDFAGRIGIPAYRLTNLGAEIRRLKKRAAVVEVVQSSDAFESYKVGEILVELMNGQIQVEFPWKPNEATRDKLKRSPIALKWSSYSGRWVRKHTATTCGEWFKKALREALEQAAP